MFIDNALKDAILKSDKLEFVTKYLPKYRNLIHNMKDVFIEKIILFANEDNVVNPRLINGLYYEAIDVSETEFDIMSAYIKHMLKKPYPFKDETSPRMAVCLLVLDTDVFKDNPDLIDTKLYKHYLSQLMDLYIPCEYPDDTVDVFAGLFKLSDIAEHPMDTNYIFDKINTGYINIPEDVNIDDIVKIYSIVSDIMVNKYVAIKTFKDWFYILYKGAYRCNAAIHTLCDRYTKYFGDETPVIIAGLVADFTSEMLDASLTHSMSEYILSVKDNVDLTSKDIQAILKYLMNDVLELVNDKIDAYRYTMIQNTIKNFWEVKFPILLINEIEPCDDMVPNEPELHRPANESKNVMLDNGLTIAIEAYKKDSVAIHKNEMKIYKAYKKYKNAEEKIDAQISNAVDEMKKVLVGNVKTEIIEGKRLSVIGLLKKVLGTVGLFAVGPIKALCVLLVKYALKKSTTVSEKRKIIMDLEAEIEMINEKIEDARSEGNKAAKYRMMRTRTELQNALARIKYGLEADEKSISTAKSVINKKYGQR